MSAGEVQLRAGFIPLLDAAVLIAASAKGFDRMQGIRLELTRDVSWSNIRDRLAFRQFDVAHMLGPMAVAAQLGLGSNPYPVIAPFALGTGGNAITLSARLFERMQAAVEPGAPDEAHRHGLALRRVVEERRRRGEPSLVFGVTYPFSSHNYEFRFWMAEAGIDPDRDVTMTVVPPPFTTDALRAGAIDGFCVNAPWNAAAVEAGIGRIVAVKADIWPGSPEKVLGVRPDWWEDNRETGEGLLVALDAAARWCDDPNNRAELAAILARPEHVGGPEAIIHSVLEGRLPVGERGAVRDIPNYLVFHGEGTANRPDPDGALWVYSQMVRWGQAPYRPPLAERAAAAFRPDLFAAALGRGRAAPSAPDRFDPTQIKAYVRSFAIRREAPDTTEPPATE